MMQHSVWFSRLICKSLLFVNMISQAILRTVNRERQIRAWHNLLLFLFMFFIHLIIPFGKFGPSYLGNATAAARAALPSPTSACWVFSCFRNPSNSDDMYYMIFNVRTWSFLCERFNGIHTGVGHTDNESAHHSRVRRSTNWATPSPHERNSDSLVKAHFTLWRSMAGGSTAKDHTRAKQNAFLPQVQILIHYLKHIPPLMIWEMWGKKTLIHTCLWVLTAPTWHLGILKQNEMEKKKEKRKKASNTSEINIVVHGIIHHRTIGTQCNLNHTCADLRW